jgi:hypothetical protein
MQLKPTGYTIFGVVYNCALMTDTTIFDSTFQQDTDFNTFIVDAITVLDCMPRFGGQTCSSACYWTVGSHTYNGMAFLQYLHTTESLEDFGFCADQYNDIGTGFFFHDFSECFTGDIPTPSKNLLRNLAGFNLFEFEELFTANLFRRYTGRPYLVQPHVKLLDSIVLDVEYCCSWKPADLHTYFQSPLSKNTYTELQIALLISYVGKIQNLVPHWDLSDHYRKQQLKTKGETL